MCLRSGCGSSRLQQQWEASGQSSILACSIRTCSGDAQGACANTFQELAAAGHSFPLHAFTWLQLLHYNYNAYSMMFARAVLRSFQL